MLGRDANVIPISEAELGVAQYTVNLADLVFPYPAQHYLLDGQKLERDFGLKMTTGNRRMLEEHAQRWATVDDHSPRRYPREDKALAALGLRPG